MSNNSKQLIWSHPCFETIHLGSIPYLTSSEEEQTVRGQEFKSGYSRDFVRGKSGDGEYNDNIPSDRHCKTSETDNRLSERDRGRSVSTSHRNDKVSSGSSRPSHSTDDGEIYKYTSSVRHDPDRIMEKPCYICAVRYSDNYSPWDHCYGHAWACNGCDFTTYAKRSLELHYTKEHSETTGNGDSFLIYSFFCLFCKEKKTDDNYENAETWLKIHLLDKHIQKKPRYRCKVKGCRIKGRWSFELPDDLIKHERAQHIDDRGNYGMNKTVEDLFHYKCEACPMFLFSLDAFAYHSRTHARENVDESNPKLHDNPIPGKELGPYHGPNTTDECGVCKERFEENYSVWDHSRIHVWCCLDCPFTADDIHVLGAHKKEESHHSEPPHGSGYFFCLLCNDKIECSAINSYFNAVDQLDNHKREYHLDLRTSFKCKLCSFSVRREDGRQLIKHEKTVHNDVLQTTEKHFQCKNCKRLVMSRVKLEEHVIIAHGNFSYRDKVSIKPTEDEIHDKPFADDQDAQSSSNKRIRGRPEVINNNFKCDFCDTNFESRFERAKHLSRVHGSDVEMNFVMQRRMLQTNRRKLRRQMKKGNKKQDRLGNR